MPPLQRLDEALGVGRRGHRAQAQVPVGRSALQDLRLPSDGAVDTVSSASTAPARGRQTAGQETGRGKVLRTYKWSQFFGKEEITEFDEAHFSVDGIFSQSSSEGHKEYQDRLRAGHLHREGMSKADIAKALGRSEKFVQRWWQKDQKEIPRPWGVHEYLTKDMGKNSRGVGSTNGASLTETSVRDTATWWRDVEVRRGYGADPAIYDEILLNTEWKPTNARTRDFATGAFHLKYDKQGNIKWEGHQNGKYKPGLSPAMDKVMQKLFAEYGIADSTSGVITNWYPDGQGYLGSHRHDCWTALFSFGQERILTMDNTPILMQDGDLCIFGTQRHGVPLMPEVTEGRITLVIFFYPDKTQKKAMWQTITDDQTLQEAEKMEGLLRKDALGSAGRSQQPAEHSREIAALQLLGFSHVDAELALRASQGDVERAAEFLLMAGAAAPVCDAGTELVVTQPALCNAADISVESAPAPAPGGRFRKARATEATSQSPAPSSSSTAAPSGSACSSSSSSSSECSDEALARRLQMEEQGGRQGLEVTSEMNDAEVAALALQLDELEAQRQADPSLLAAQFQEYEAMLDVADAERWNGHGDLMHSPFSREHLSIEKMEKVTLYCVGHGDMLEKDFWEMLQCHSIRVLYDIRPTDYRGELHSRHQRFSTAALRSQCRSRGVVFKPMPLGRHSAYGTLAHIKTDEGRHTLVELVWQAKRRRTAFLGAEELWQHDARQVAAELLAQAGHTIEHVHPDGSTERHETGREYPDWLLREEERLRSLEKQRQAGELAAPHKSRVARSSEVVASRLAAPVEQVDAMGEMRAAANQRELVVAQRKLARYQRLAEQKGPLASKVVAGAPQWILEDARKQAEWVAAKKQEKEAKAVSGPAAPAVEPEDAMPPGFEDEGDEEGGAATVALLEGAGLLEEVMAEAACLEEQGDEASAGVTEGFEEVVAAATCGEAEVDSECQNNGEQRKSTWRGRRRAAASSSSGV